MKGKLKMLMAQCVSSLRKQYPNASDEEIKQMAVDKCKQMMEGKGSAC